MKSMTAAVFIVKFGFSARFRTQWWNRIWNSSFFFEFSVSVQSFDLVAYSGNYGECFAPICAHVSRRHVHSVISTNFTFDYNFKYEISRWFRIWQWKLPLSSISLRNIPKPKNDQHFREMENFHCRFWGRHGSQFRNLERNTNFAFDSIFGYEISRWFRI